MNCEETKGTVIKVSQAVSGEIVSEKLIDTFMRTAIENAGAERGLLFLFRGSELRVEAEGVTGGDGIIVRLADTFADPPAAPESIINYVCARKRLSSSMMLRIRFL